jgi:hypothetical protein
MGTQFRLAQCYEKVGRLASARRNYLDVAATARDKGLVKRESFARKQADRLAPRLSKIAIRVSAELSILPGLRVLHNGTVIPSASWGGLPVDLGTHRLRAEADGKQPWTVEIEITAEGQRFAVKVPLLTDAGPTRAAPPPTVLAVGPAPKADRVGDGKHSRKTAGMVVAGVGIVAMGAGIGLGAAAKSKWDDSVSHCGAAIPGNTGPGANDRCLQTGVDIRTAARSTGNIGTGLFIAGAVGIVAGAVLWLTAPSDTDEANRNTRLKIGFRPASGGVAIELGGGWW